MSAVRPAPTMGDHPLNRAVPVALVLLLVFTLVPLNHEVLKDEAVVFSAGGYDPGVSGSSAPSKVIAMRTPVLTDSSAQSPSSALASS